VHIFLFRVKLHEKSESGPKNLKKVYFQAQIGLFVVLTTMTAHESNLARYLANSHQEARTYKILQDDRLSKI
jgi:hypothetical protein